MRLVLAQLQAINAKMDATLMSLPLRQLVGERGWLVITAATPDQLETAQTMLRRHGLAACKMAAYMYGRYGSLRFMALAAAVGRQDFAAPISSRVAGYSALMTNVDLDVSEGFLPPAVEVLDLFGSSRHDWTGRSGASWRGLSTERGLAFEIDALLGLGTPPLFASGDQYAP